MIINNRIIPGISGVGGINPNVGSSQSTAQGSGISFEALLQKQIYGSM